MKRRILSYFLAAAAICFAAAACSKEEEPDMSKATIKLVGDGVVYLDEASKAVFEVKTQPDNLITDESVLYICTTALNNLPECKIVSKNQVAKGQWRFVVYVNNASFTKKEVVLKCNLSGKDYVASDKFTIKRAVARIASVRIDGYDASFDEATNTYSIVKPTETSFADIMTVIEWEGDRLEVNGTEYKTVNGRFDYKKPLDVKVYAGEIVSEYTLKVKNTGLPVVRITTPGYKGIYSKTEWMEGATIRIDTPDGEVDLEATTGIRGRGNSTWNYPKKPYALRLEEKAEVLGMPKGKRWVLLANWKDRTLLRNEAAFWMSRHSGLDYTVRGQFVELVLNNKHLGNYYLCEQIRIAKHRVPITEMEPQETDPEKITGGFLMELDSYYDEQNRFHSARFSLPYMFKEPDDEDISKEAINYFKGYITDLENLLKDNTRLQNHEYEDYLDVDSSIWYMIVEELTNNTDFYNTWPANGPHSCFMHKDRGGKLVFGPVWDFDYHGFVPTYSYFWAGATKTLYYPALVKDEKYRQRMIEIWDTHKDELYGLVDYIDEMADKIRLSESYNQAMWPISNNENGDEKMTFQQAVDRIKDGFVKKWKWMDTNIRSLK